MNLSSSPAAAVLAFIASTLLLAACGAGADPAGGGAGSVTDPAGAGAPGATATLTQPASAAATAPGAGHGGPHRLRQATANGTPHHRRPSHSAPLLYTRR